MQLEFMNSHKICEAKTKTKIKKLLEQANIKIEKQKYNLVQESEKIIITF